MNIDIRVSAILFFAVFLSAISGCATIGNEFPADPVADIRLNQTTQENIQSMFGPPWRTGMEDGKRTWTYGRYTYRAFGDSIAKDLVIRFGSDNTVASYTFSTTEPQP